MQRYKQGQTVRITATFRNFSDALTNPSQVNFFIQTEADDVWTETAGVAADSTGVYHLDVDTTDQSGIYDWRVMGTGTTPAANQGQFYVIPGLPSDTDPSP